MLSVGSCRIHLLMGLFVSVDGSHEADNPAYCCVASHQGVCRVLAFHADIRPVTFCKLSSFFYNHSDTNSSYPMGAFRYSMLRSSCVVIALGKRGFCVNRQALMVERVPYSRHFFHLKRRPVLGEQSLMILATSARALGVPMSAVSSLRKVFVEVRGYP